MSWYKKHLESSFIMELSQVVEIINEELDKLELSFTKDTFMVDESMVNDPIFKEKLKDAKSSKKSILYKFVNQINAVIKVYSQQGFFVRPSIEKNFRICLWENLDTWRRNSEKNEYPFFGLDFSWPDDDQMEYIIKKCLYSSSK